MNLLKHSVLCAALIGMAGTQAKAELTIEYTLPLATHFFLKEYAIRGGYIPFRTYPADCWQGVATLATYAITSAVLNFTIDQKLWPFIFSQKFSKTEYVMGIHLAKLLFVQTATLSLDYVLGKILYHGILKKNNPEKVTLPTQEIL